MFRWALALFLTLVVLFLLMAATARDRESTSAAENVVSTVLFPFQLVTNWVADQVRGVGVGAAELWNMRAENARLRDAAAQYPGLEAELLQAQRENDRLRQEIGLRATVPYPLLAADVIGRDPRSWFDTVVINRGSKDGLRENHAVINSDGLVGKVQRVTQLTATVKLLVDPRFALSVMDALTAEVGGLESHGPEEILVTFSHNRDARVSEGDPVVTSGLGGVVPKGLYIGSVATVGTLNQGLTRYAIIRPAVDFQRLDLVQVVITEPENGVGVDNP